MEERTIFQSAARAVSVRQGVRLNGIYEIGPLIAHGGMGEVYRGFNIETNDPVAIKMILPELANDSDVIAMFRREASTLLNLHHEAIVSYYVFSVDPELKRAYLAMEFVDGPSLSRKLLEGPLPIADVYILQRRLADALFTAHQLGVIHRDISSDNVILPGGQPRRAKIIDFGIARSRQPGEHTIIGDGFAGKHNYAAPEQLGLAGGNVTAKTDIYSLGLVLAEAARGYPIDMGGSQVEIIEKRRKVPDLSDIDPSIRPLLTRMLQPAPTNRPESMAAVAAWTPAGSQRKRPAIAGGLAAAIAAGIILTVSLGGTAYVFRDLLRWGKLGPTEAQKADRDGAPSSPEPQQKPALSEAPTNKLPPLPPASPASLPPSSSQTLAPLEPQTQQVPTADDLVNERKRLQNQAQPTELGANFSHPTGPSSAIKPPSPVPKTEAAPIVPPAARLDADTPPATEAPGPTASLDAQKRPEKSEASSSAPQAAQSLLLLDDAIVGKNYTAPLPPFSDAADTKRLTLRVDPVLPEGLALSDFGSGFGQISGTPSRPGKYAFDIVASDQRGSAARMTTKLTVVGLSPPVQQSGTLSPSLSVAATPKDKADNYLRSFDGGGCFLTHSLGLTNSMPVILGVGADKATFERFYEGFNREVGIEPNVNVRLISLAQCPSINLIAAGLSNSDAPKIELASFDVGRNKPLIGTVSNLGNRNLALLLVTSDGQVRRIDTRSSANGAASFSVPLIGDTATNNLMQVVVAVASPTPLPSLVQFKIGAAADVLPQVQRDVSLAGASLGTEFFKLAD